MRFAFFIHLEALFASFCQLVESQHVPGDNTSTKISPGIFKEDLMSSWFPLSFSMVWVCHKTIYRCVNLFKLTWWPFILMSFWSFMKLIYLKSHFPGALWLQLTSPKTLKLKCRPRRNSCMMMSCLWAFQRCRWHAEIRCGKSSRAMTS